MTNEIQNIVSDQNDVITLQKRQLDALCAGGFLPKGCTKEEAFATSIRPCSRISKTPISLVDPNLFFTPRRIR